ncbi:hypothetical protein GJ496_005846 [Pomphorhynchus laevis]|nr:hypothetical protein GJ496_005846 [Pomphorhynchus laevis]
MNGNSVESTFESLGLSEWILKQCSQFGFHRPSPVQFNCIPAILNKKDVLACAKTGSGKTAAFVLPILEDISKDPFSIHTLVLTPTRELASQIIDQFRLFGRVINLRASLIIGGLSRLEQTDELSQKPHVIVSTPGRLADLLLTYSDQIRLNAIRFLVIDEADRLFVDNFFGQFGVIFKALEGSNCTRQTLLFSATMTDTLEKLKSIAFSNSPDTIPDTLMTYREDIEELVPYTTVASLEESYALVQIKLKDACLFITLKNFIKENPVSSVLVFTRTCKYCHVLYLMCRRMGISCLTLHSLISQKQRLKSLARFRAFEKRILFATDVAARGLDLPTVDLVINHNVPFLPKQYIHRVGRTARAGRCGKAITLVSQYEIDRVCKLEKKINKTLAKFEWNEKLAVEIMPELELIKSQLNLDLDQGEFAERQRARKNHKLKQAENEF